MQGPADGGQGGGVIGCSTAYFLTRHRLYDPHIHSITILEATEIAGGSSGKAGGFIASWATPKCLAPLSFQLHSELAKEHGGDTRWGHRRVYAADVELRAQDLDEAPPSETPEDANAGHPKALDWLAPGALQSYHEVGTPADSGQVHPYLFTTALAALAQERGAQLLIGSATAINPAAHDNGVESVAYRTSDGTTATLAATDVVAAAGPWTPALLPAVRLLAPRGHSIVVRPARALSPHILFPSITAAPGSKLKDVISPDIYPRPADRLYTHETVYASGPDDYAAPLPAGTDAVAVDDASVQQVCDAVRAVSREVHDGAVLARQACHKPQIRKHGEGEAVGPMVGTMGVRGLWLATGHDEWGVQNAPGTGRVVSEMVFEGRARSADCGALNPRRFLEGGEGG